MNETASASLAPRRLATPGPVFLRCLLVLATAAYFGFFFSHPRLLPALGVHDFGVWFLDSFAVLASNDALARGLDVYAANPLDYLQRPHVYSEWWLVLGKLGLTRADNFRFGLALVLAFFAVAFAGLRPRAYRELLWYLAIICSSPVLLAVQRANNDLAVFIVLAAVVPCLQSDSGLGRIGAGLVVAFATGLKFYPAAAGLLLLGGAGMSRSSVQRGLVVGAGAIAVVLVSLAPDLARMGAMLPSVKAEGLMSFGAGNLLGALGMSGWPALATAAAAALVLAAMFIRWRPYEDTGVTAADRAAWLRFVLGAAVLTACFFSGMNFAYRWIFALWLAPFLWKASRDRAFPRMRRFAMITAGLLAVALWADAVAAFALTRVAGQVPGATLVRWADRFFLAEQPVTWAFFACLIGWLVDFVRTEGRFLLGRSLAS